MIIHEVEQNSPEWFELRKGKFTCSEAQAIATAGVGLDTLCYKKVAEMLSHGATEGYTNEDMIRGHEQEKYAVGLYEIETGVQTTVVGFVEYDENTGGSPDRLVGDDGMAEVKCPNDINFVKYMLTGKIQPEYDWQMQMQMLITGRKWVDYVVYNENFDDSLIIKRVFRDEAKIEKLKIGLEQGIKQYKSLVKQLEDKNVK